MQPHPQLIEHMKRLQHQPHHLVPQTLPLPHPFQLIQLQHHLFPIIIMQTLLLPQPLHLLQLQLLKPLLLQQQPLAKVYHQLSKGGFSSHLLPLSVWLPSSFTFAKLQANQSKKETPYFHLQSCSQRILLHLFKRRENLVIKPLLNSSTISRKKLPLLQLALALSQLVLQNPPPSGYPRPHQNHQLYLQP